MPHASRAGHQSVQRNATERSAASANPFSGFLQLDLLVIALADAEERDVFGADEHAYAAADWNLRSTRAIGGYPPDVPHVLPLEGLDDDISRAPAEMESDIQPSVPRLRPWIALAGNHRIRFEVIDC